MKYPALTPPWRLGASVSFAVLACLLATPAPACTGDCDGSGDVAISELVRGVNIALDEMPLDQCPSFDRDGSESVSVDELIAGVMAALDRCPVEPVFPENYRDTFTEVRDCRFSIEHGGVSVRVLTNPVAVEPYLDEVDTLPVGSIVVKEEFDGPDCLDADLVLWSAMRKEAPGFDPADADWHWQEVEPDRTVRFDDKKTCIGCHIRPECRARDYMCTEGAGRGRLTAVLRNLPVALLSVAGTAADDVYAVGADPDDGFGPYVLRYQGQRWRRLNTGATGDLWWVSVTPIGGAFYMAGENGLILRYDPVADTFERQTTPGIALLYGVWGTDANHIWAVGGDPANEEQGGAVWFYDGTRWAVDDDLARTRPEGVPTLYKVWGRSENEVYVAGRLGVVFLFDGVRWTQLDNEQTRPLFTVHGNDSIVAAVGGVGDGVILERDGTAMANRTFAGAPQFNGVFIPPNGEGVAVGVAGSLALRTDDGWELADTGLNTILELHATWVDSEGGIWAVGGDVSGDLNQGLLAYGGSRSIGSEVVDVARCPPSEDSGPMTVSYTDDIVPLFTASGCVTATCHGGAFPASGYDMRTYEKSFGPGSAARTLELCEIVPGDPDASFLIEKLLPNPRFGMQMPTNRPALSASDIELIRTWIREGAQNDAPPTPTGNGATRTPTRTPTRTRSVTPGVTLTPAAVCAQAGIICTMAGTGQSVFDGDGKPARLTSLYYPFDVGFDASGRPLIIDWNNLRLRRIASNGIVSTIMGRDFEAPPTEGALAVDTPLHHSSDVELDAAGNLYVAGNHSPVVFRVGTDDRVAIVAGTEQAGYDGDGGPARMAKLTTPYGVFPDGDGGVYIADAGAHVVRYVDSAGMIRTVAGTGPIPGTRAGGYSGDGGPAVAAQLNGPTRLRLDGEGNLLICDTNNHVVRKVDGAGVITTIAGTGTFGYTGDGGPAAAAQLNTPYDLRVAANNDIYLADSGNNVIRRIDRASGTISTVVGTQTPGFAGDEGDAHACELKFPVGIELADDGSLWIADTFNQRVRRVAGFLAP